MDLGKRYQGCLRKRGYLTMNAALDAAAKPSAPRPLYAYECLYCNRYHLTKSDRAGKKRKKRQRQRRRAAERRASPHGDEDDR